MGCGQQSQKNEIRGRNAVDQIILTGGRTNECYSKISEPRPLNLKTMNKSCHILVKFSLGEMGGLLMKSKKSWRNQKYLGEIDSMLVKSEISW